MAELFIFALGTLVGFITAAMFAVGAREDER